MGAFNSTLATRCLTRSSTVTHESVLEVGHHVREALGGVFEADAEYGALEELEESDEVAFGFSREDAAKAFDDAGLLRERLPLYCSSSGRGQLQVAFAYHGLVASIPVSAEADEDAFLAPDAAARESDLRTILASFDALRLAGVEAEPHLGISRTDGLSELTSPSDSSAIFWHEQSHDAFDSSGNLREPLHLHWKGNRETIAQTLRDVLPGSGLSVDIPADETTTFIIRRGPTITNSSKVATPSPTQRFELSSGASNKFWEISIEGVSIITRYGKIGSKGQETRKNFEWLSRKICGLTA